MPEQEGVLHAAAEPAVRAMVKPTRGQLIVAVLLAVLGFAAVAQVRTNTVDDTYAGLREQDLIDILDGLADQTQRARAGGDPASRGDARRAPVGDGSREAALEQARNEADTLAIIAGRSPSPVRVCGSRSRRSTARSGLEPFIDMVQALRSAGAEAIQINGDVRGGGLDLVPGRGGRGARRRADPQRAVHRRRDPGAPRRSAPPCASPTDRRSSSPRTAPRS